MPYIQTSQTACKSISKSWRSVFSLCCHLVRVPPLLHTPSRLLRHANDEDRDQENRIVPTFHFRRPARMRVRRVKGCPRAHSYSLPVHEKAAVVAIGALHDEYSWRQRIRHVFDPTTSRPCCADAAIDGLAPTKERRFATADSKWSSSHQRCDRPWGTGAAQSRIASDGRTPPLPIRCDIVSIRSSFTLLLRYGHLGSQLDHPGVVGR